MRYKMPYSSIRRLTLAYRAEGRTVEALLADLAKAGYRGATARQARELFPKGL